MSESETVVAGHRVPLESDLTTPLAYFLSRPEMNLESFATKGLLRPETLLEIHPGVRPVVGLYMVQPYEPGKIPVLLVHGLWSTPMTWMEMFNDLRSQPEIRDHYQFWFYMYPTAQPFWLSAAQLRRDLATVRDVLDPHHQEPALDEMVVIGHSMGGLLARLQTDAKSRRLLALGQPRAAVAGQGRRPIAATSERHLLLPAQPVDPPGHHHRHAEPRQHVFEPDHAMAARPVDPSAHRAIEQPAEAVSRQSGGLCRGLAASD